MNETASSEAVTRIALITGLAMVGIVATGAASVLATTNAGIGLTAVGAATPVPGDGMVGMYVFMKGAQMNMPTGPGGAAAKFGTMA